MSNYQNEIVYSGRLISYFLVAYNEFVKNQNALHNFRICFLENESEIKVTFSPKFAIGEVVLGGRTSLGHEVSYIISKKDYSILKVHYSR